MSKDIWLETYKKTHPVKKGYPDKKISGNYKCPKCRRASLSFDGFQERVCPLCGTVFGL